MNKTILLIVFLLTSCNPYQGEPVATATEAAQIVPAKSRSQDATVIPTPTPHCRVNTGVPAGLLNMRAAAGVSHAVIRVLAEGETLTVISAGAWLEVIDAQGNHGYIKSNYCRLENKTSWKR